MSKANKSDQLSKRIAVAMLTLMQFEPEEGRYRRLSKANIREYLSKQDSSNGTELKNELWRIAVNKTMDRMRHAGAAKEATNSYRNRTTTSRDEIEIIDAEAVKTVADDILADKPELPQLEIQPTAPSDKLAVAITQKIDDAMFYAGVINAHILNEGDTKYRVQEDNRSIWSNKAWPIAWKQVTDYLVTQGVLVRREKKTQFRVEDLEGIQALANNPTPVVLHHVITSRSKARRLMTSQPDVVHPNQVMSPAVTSAQHGYRYGYLRISWALKNNLQDRDKIIAEGVDEIFTDQPAGHLVVQPEWQRLMSVVKPGDTIIVSNLIQMSLNAKTCLQNIQWLVAHQVNLTILAIGRLIEFDDQNKLTKASIAMIKTFEAVKDLQRAAIVERTQTGKAYARAHDLSYQEGRKPVITGERQVRLLAYYQDHTIQETIAAFGISKSTLLRRVAEARVRGEINVTDRPDTTN